jgi:hypothetical protein
MLRTHWDYVTLDFAAVGEVSEGPRRDDRVRFTYVAALRGLVHLLQPLPTSDTAVVRSLLAACPVPSKRCGQVRVG